MQSHIHVSQTPLTRQEALYLWLKRRGISIASLGREMGIKRAAAWAILNRERAPVHRVAQLVALGVPVELLPRAEDVPSGPKPGWKQRAEATA